LPTTRVEGRAADLRVWVGFEGQAIREPAGGRRPGFVDVTVSRGGREGAAPG